MTNVKINNRKIGDGYPAFTIAEVGLNHNGSLDNAFKMIEVAKASGADAVKFQTFKAHEFVSDPTQSFTYQSQGSEVTESMLEMFKRYEFSTDLWPVIKKRCDEIGIMFLSTPQNYSDLEILLEVGIDAIKVGSDDFTNLPLLKQYASTGLPLIVSSGMANLAEAYEAFEAIGSFDGYPTILLHCTSQYPTPATDMNLNKIATLRAAFPMVVIGYSDHTQGPMAAALARAKGAALFEKHFTLSHELPGPDHWFSEDPRGLKEWVENIHLADSMLGSGVIRPTAAEQAMKTLARRSVVALADIKQGEQLTSDKIGLRRPGNGIPPKLYEKIIGTNATRDIKKNELIDWGAFA